MKRRRTRLVFLHQPDGYEQRLAIFWMLKVHDVAEGVKVPPQVAIAAGGARKQRQPNPLAPVFEFEKHLCVEGKHGHKRRRKARAGAVAAHDEARGGVAKEEVDDGCDGEDACVEPKEGEDAPADAAQGSARSADVASGLAATRRAPSDVALKTK
jgi:hypothetical protein